MIGSIKMYFNVAGIGGLLHALRGKATNSQYLYTLKREGDSAHPVRVRIPTSDVSAYKQVFVEHEYDFLAKVSPSTIVDAGANIGLASIYFSSKYPRARVFAIEPERSNFELLRENVKPYPNIIPIHAALWNKNEEINIVDPGLGKWGFMTEGKDGTNSKSNSALHTVQAITVDGLMKEFSIERINILKVDIEGAEREVFSDTSAWIANVDSIIIELHERMKEGCNRSFYCGSSGFDKEWKQGENVYLSRAGYLERPGNVR